MLNNPILVLHILISTALAAFICPNLTRVIIPLVGNTPIIQSAAYCVFYASLALSCLALIIQRKLPSFMARSAVYFSLLLVGFGLTFFSISSPSDLSSSQFGYTFCSLFASYGLMLTGLLLSAFSHICEPTPLTTQNCQVKIIGLAALGLSLGYLLFMVVEPYIGMTVFKRIWQIAIAGHILFSGALWFHIYQYSTSPLITQSPQEKPLSSISYFWFLVPLATSALTTHTAGQLSSELSAFGVFTIIPSILFWVSFGAAFLVSSEKWKDAKWPEIGFYVFLVPTLGCYIFDLHSEHAVVNIISITFLFFACLSLHLNLVEKIQEITLLPYKLGLFGLGMLAGGLSVQLLGPVIFPSVIEYTLVFLGVCLLAKPNETRKIHWCDFIIPGLMVAIFIGLKFVPQEQEAFTILLMTTLIAAVALMNHHKIAFSLSIFALLLTAHMHSRDHKLIYKERSLFGLSEVRDYSDGVRRYMNGNTVHGAQLIDLDAKHHKLSYYYMGSPAADAFAAYQETLPGKPICDIGLGIGILASYAEKDQPMDFIEIDPVVQKIAEQHFTYLKDSKGKIGVKIGDGRIVLSQSKPNYYGLIFIDAFTSDAIPSHLLTKEAFAMYLSKLEKDGCIVIHVTNRHYDFEPVAIGLAKQFGLLLAEGSDEEYETEEHDEEIFYYSKLYTLTYNKKLMENLLKSKMWHEHNLTGPQILWTDDYTDVMPLLKKTSEEEE